MNFNPMKSRPFVSIAPSINMSAGRLEGIYKTEIREGGIHIRNLKEKNGSAQVTSQREQTKAYKSWTGRQVWRVRIRQAVVSEEGCSKTTSWVDTMDLA